VLSTEKFSKRGMFLPAENVVSPHHVSPPIHHNLTIKTPRSAPHFSQKPLQKRPSTTPTFFSPVTIKKSPVAAFP
jgi:hypothetical protein